MLTALLWLVIASGTCAAEPGIVDHIDFGLAESERAHKCVDDGHGGSGVLGEVLGSLPVRYSCRYTGGHGSSFKARIALRPHVPNTLIVREMHVSHDRSDPTARDLYDIHTNACLSFDTGQPGMVTVEPDRPVRQWFRAGPNTNRVHGVAVRIERTGFERIADLNKCYMRLRVLDVDGRMLAGPVLKFPTVMPGKFGWATFWLAFPARVEPGGRYAVEFSVPKQMPPGCTYRLRSYRGSRPNRIGKLTVGGAEQPDQALAMRIGPAHRTCYDMLINGRPWRPGGSAAGRDLYDYGASPVSYFVDLPPTDQREITLTFINRMPVDVNRVYIADVWSVAELDRWARRFDRPFTVGFVVPHGELHVEKCAGIIARGFKSRSDLLVGGNVVRPAIGIEYHYFHHDSERTARDFRGYFDLVAKLNLHLQLGLSATWAGTPGQPWRRPEHQQIVYSKTDNYWDPGIRSLGPPYDSDVHYGFSFPNMWSSCPWLSVTHPGFRRARLDRLRATAAILEKHANERLALVMGDNEPAFWGYQMWSADGHYAKVNNGARRMYPLADVGPATVAAAKRDNVILDPRDGFDTAERAWLARHMSAWLRDSYGVIADVLGRDAPIHVQAMAGVWYPQDSPFRPGFEIGLLPNVPRPGLESSVIRRNPDLIEWGESDERPYFERAINLGTTAQTNHETCMSRPAELTEAQRIAYEFGLTNYIFFNTWARGTSDFNPAWKKPLTTFAATITREQVNKRRRALAIQHLAKQAAPTPPVGSPRK